KAHYNLGRLLQYARRDLAGAIASYRKALALAPDYALAHWNLGLALAEQKDLDGAIAHCRKAVTLEPRDARAHSALGPVLLRAGRFAEAQATLRRALDLLPPGRPFREHVAQQVRECERLQEQDERPKGGKDR